MHLTSNMIDNITARIIRIQNVLMYVLLHLLKELELGGSRPDPQHLLSYLAEGVSKTVRRLNPQPSPTTKTLVLINTVSTKSKERNQSQWPIQPYMTLVYNNTAYWSTDHKPGENISTNKLCSCINKHHSPGKKSAVYCAVVQVRLQRPSMECLNWHRASFNGAQINQHETVTRTTQAYASVNVYGTCSALITQL